MFLALINISMYLVLLILMYHLVGHSSLIELKSISDRELKT